MTALEARLRVFANDVLQEFGHFLELVGRGVETYANRCQYAQLRQAAEIAHAAPQDVGVRQNDLFAALAAQASGLDADVLDLADEGVDDQVIADHKGLVEGDRQRGEQVAQDILQGERHRHAAYAQAGKQGGDIDADIAEHHEDQQ